MLVPTINGIPVLLPAHEHSEFGTPGKHYHIDFRFLKDEPRQDKVIHSNEEPIYKNVKRVRKEYTIISNSITLLRHLADKFAKCKARKEGDCLLCPHKGLPIMNGICVGHGLSFDNNGNVITNLRLKLGEMEQPLSLKKYYEFRATYDGNVNRLEVTTPTKVISVVKLNTPIHFHKYDIINITIGR